LDLFQDSAIDTHQSPKGRAAVAIDHVEQRRSLRVILPCTIRFEPHEFRKRGTGNAASKVVSRASKPIQILLRQINTSHGVILRNIAKNVCELKRDAQLRSELEHLGILKTK